MVDYGVGNLMSVLQALEYCGANAICTSDVKLLQKADKIILPGVGAFPKAMEELTSRGLVEPLREFAYQGKPLLGICLGMQLLLEESEEFGFTKGLGIISGRVTPIPVKTKEGIPLKMPSIGWSNLIPSERCSWKGSLLDMHCSKDAVYFVHSFMASPHNQCARLADYLYGGTRIPAVIHQGKVVGCQFHPEKSGKTGLKIINRFLSS